MTNKIRLGLYMSTPMMGGAEQYFKDLLWHVDRTKFEVNLFYDAWPEFDEFLQVHQCPDIKIYPVGIIEIGGRITQLKPIETKSKSVSFPGKIVRKLNNIRQRTTFLRLIVRFLYLALRYASIPVNFFILWLAFRVCKIDVLHINNGGYPGALSAQLAAKAAKIAGCKHTIMTVCNMPQIDKPFRNLERPFDRWVAKSLDKVIVPSNIIGNALVEHCGFNASQMEKIYYAVYPPTTFVSEKNEIKKYNWESKIVIGMVASFLTHKGQKYLVEATSVLHKQNPDILVVFVGDGPTKEKIQQYAYELNLDDCVVFTGYCSLPDTLDIMQKFDIFALPSDLEGMPYVILHAMSLSKPVVATSVGGIPEQIETGKTGFVIPPGITVTLTRALQFLIDNPGVRQRMGELGYQRYQTYFTVERMLSDHEKLYQSLYEANKN